MYQSEKGKKYFEEIAMI